MTETARPWPLHEGVIKAQYGDQVPSDVEPITVSWMPQA